MASNPMKKTIGSPDGFPFTPILEKFNLNVLAKPPKETYLIGQIPIVVVRKYVISIIISPLVVNIKMFFGGERISFVAEGISQTGMRSFLIHLRPICPAYRSWNPRSI